MRTARHRAPGRPESPSRPRPVSRPGRTLACAAVTGVLGAVSFAGIAAASGLAPGAVTIPSCFGKRATIVVTKDGVHVTGTPGPDVIVVTAPKGAWVDGGGGNDLICGGPGNDHLIGGAGDDKLDGRGGDNVLEGGAGNDLLIGRAGDSLNGGAGKNTYKDGAPAIGSALVPGGASPSDAATILNPQPGDIVDGSAVPPSQETPNVQLLPAEDLIAGPAVAPLSVPAPVVAPPDSAGPELAPAPAASSAPVGTGCPVPTAVGAAAAALTPAGTTGTTYPQDDASWDPAPPATGAPAVALQGLPGSVKAGAVALPAVVAPGGVAISGWEVDFGDGQSRSGLGAAPAVVRHVFKTPGSYLVTLTVHAGPQLLSQGSSTVVVQGKTTTAVLLPQPGAGATSAPVQQGAPTTLDLTGSFPAAGKELVSATVDFGDCTAIATLTGPVSGWTSLHSYAALGLHTVTVTVTDSSGTVSKASTVLDVVAPVVALPPVTTASASAAAPAAAPTSIGDWSSTPGTPAVAPLAPVAPTGDAQPAWS